MVLRDRTINIGKYSRRLFLCLAVLLLAGLVTAGTGPTFASAASPGVGDLKWSWKLDNTGMMGLSSPATDGEEFFFTSSNLEGAPTLYRLDRNGAQTGAHLMKDARKTYNTVAPTIAGDRLLVPLDDVDQSHGPQIAVLDKNTLEEVQRITYADYTEYPEYQGEQAQEKPYGFQTNVRIAWDPEENAAYVGSWRQSKNVTIHGTYVKISLDDGTVTKLADDAGGFYWAGAAVGDRYVVFGSNSRPSDGSPATGGTEATGDAVIYAYDRASANAGKGVGAEAAGDAGAGANVGSGAGAKAAGDAGAKGVGDAGADPVVLSATLKGSGSICSDVVWDGTYYYAMAKSGSLYRISIENGEMQVKQWKIFSGGSSTCTPVILDGKIYVGGETNGRGSVSVLDATNGRRLVTYGAPADVKKILISGNAIYCVYNNRPGGIYDVRNQRDYFVPAKSMQNYCISTLLQDDAGVMYYVNDSYHFMAVEPFTFAPIAAPTVKKASLAKNATAGKVKVSWKKIKGVNGYQVSQAKKATGKNIVAKAVTGGSVKVSAKKKVVYYYKVRAYKKVGSKTYYGPWSGVKKFKLK